MQLDASCITCLLQRQAKAAESQNDPANAYHYLRDVMQILLDAPKGVAAPYLMPLFDDAFAKYWGAGDRYAAVKHASNQLMLEKLPAMRRMIAEADDPLLLALKFAQTGNYIDFGALGDSVSSETLEELIVHTPDNPVDLSEYKHFQEDLKRSRALLYIGDNAGEIVADLAFVERIKAQYPRLRVTFAVRGGPALNDATREDAAEIGLDQLVPLVDNGSRISGTELAYLGSEMRIALDEADVILAKGQANFETLASCGLNIYYLFLCKCERFLRLFQVPPLTGMFVCERRLRFPVPCP